MSPPVCRPPPVQGCTVLWPVGFQIIGRLEVVLVGNGTPAHVAGLVRARSLNVLKQPLLACANRNEVPLCLDQRWLIRATMKRRPSELNEIVFPAADEADLVGAWRLA